MTTGLAGYVEAVARRVGLRKRQRVIARDGRECYLCGRLCITYPQNEGVQRPSTLTLDHVTPLVSFPWEGLEGEELEALVSEANHDDNLAVSCAACNGNKDDLMPADDEMERQLHLLRIRLHYCIPLR